MKLLLIFSFCLAALAAEWEYAGDHGPEHWEDDYEFCGGNAQSPINIVTKSAVFSDDLSDFEMTNYDEPIDVSLSNNGHTVVAALSSSPKIKMSKGDLPGTFELAQFHFHWGSDDTKGSEHQMNGNTYPMEIHFVHWNTKYSNIGEAVDKSDGLAVLGFFFEVGSSNSGFEPIIEKLESVKTKDHGNIALAGLKMIDFMGNPKGTYYRYSGSLTTPACYESVTWTVFQEPIEVSKEQMMELRKLHDANNNTLVDNYRPPQPLNGRQVTTNYQAPCPGCQDVRGNGASSVTASIVLIVSFFVVKAVLY